MNSTAMILSIVFMTFFCVNQGGAESKRSDDSSNCQLSMSKSGPYTCKEVRSCNTDKRSYGTSDITEYYCPKPTCAKKVEGKCGWEVCACEDYRGISQVGKSFFYWEENKPGINYKCSCLGDPKILSICGASCEIVMGPERVTVQPPRRPPPRFPPFPQGW
ncbi:uncharacterized protein LOC110243330 [Exaiptasia diaphana]|uniref:Uncharacterized protein n=1 Tax=Exaiptasia diaphana TaxID=2652724 RepID=A0A913XHZ2_EXADI|nr:uncharacterized protein LOC110243330 [Exaiptasia diaphana]KXJ11708.1 hypothetical protein AC249_AIPGENE10735 [Exaiptasia diaphana]